MIRVFCLHFRYNNISIRKFFIFFLQLYWGAGGGQEGANDLRGFSFTAEQVSQGFTVYFLIFKPVHTILYKTALFYYGTSKYYSSCFSSSHTPPSAGSLYRARVGDRVGGGSGGLIVLY